MQLVSNGQVEGWDDPRMPTISGYRRRGYPAAAIRDFAGRIGVSKANATVEVQSLEACVRKNLNENAERRMAVLKPLKVMIENYPEDQTEELDALNNPNDETAGSRKVPFSREFYIEQDDFMEDPPKKFFRLAPGREVRLRYAYFVTCTEVIKDDNGQVTSLRCTYDPATKGGNAPDGHKVKATLHWVSAEHAIDAQIREYEHLFTAEIPGADGEFLNDINPDSLTIVENCKLEPALQDASKGETVQFERVGYFCLDKDTSTEKMIFNKTIGLRDTWAKTQAKS
jgi:glutaminyl-tRNA synthetase